LKTGIAPTVTPRQKNFGLPISESRRAVQKNPTGDIPPVDSPQTVVKWRFIAMQNKVKQARTSIKHR